MRSRRPASVAAKLHLAPDGAQQRSALLARRRRRRTTSSSKAAARTRSPDWSRGDLYAPYWWDVRIFKPGEVERSRDPIQARRRDQRFRTPRSGSVRAGRGDESARSCGGARARRGARDGRLECRPHAVHAARAVAADAARQAASITRSSTSAPKSSATRASGCGFRSPATSSSRSRRYVHVPESFERRFRELRSANDTIAGFASVTAGVLYGVGGCILGVLWLARKHWLVVRPALIAGFVVGGLLAHRDAVRRSRGVVRIRHRAIGDDVLAAAGRRGGGGRAGRRPRVRARVHDRGEPHAPRVSRAAAALATLVEGRRERRTRCWAARSAAICSCRSSSRWSRRSTTRPTAGSAGGSRPRC